MILLQILLLLLCFGPDHPAGDHRACPLVQACLCRYASPWSHQLRIEEKYKAYSPIEKYDKGEPVIVLPAMGWW